MVDIFFMAIVVIAIGLFGGLIYLIYLPFKNRLKKSGKLTDKISKRINWTFILLPCLIGVVLYCFKDYRTPSKDRLESTINMKVPSDFKVVKDYYYDAAPMPHYQILYDIKFSNQSSVELIHKINNSAFLNSKVKPTVELYDSSYILVNGINAVWCRSTTGYRFRRVDEKNLIYYNINFDTLTNILSYEESSD